MTTVSLADGLIAALALKDIKQSPWSKEPDWVVDADIRQLAGTRGLWVLLAECTALLGPAALPRNFTVGFRDDPTLLSQWQGYGNYQWAETGPTISQSPSFIPWRPGPVVLQLSAGGNAIITRKYGNATEYLANSDGRSVSEPVEAVLSLLDSASSSAVRAAGETALDRLEQMPLRVEFVRARLHAMLREQIKSQVERAVRLARVVAASLGDSPAGRPFDRTTPLGAVFGDELPEWVYEPRFLEMIAGNTGGAVGTAALFN